MKILQFNLMMLGLVFLTSFNGSAINFETNKSWADILKKSKSENKIIFVDAYATWCGPCKKMDRDVFPDSSIKDFFNKNFVNFKIDMESKEGIKFDEKYTISSYPTFLFIDQKGEVIKKVVGGQSVEDLLRIGNFIKNPNNTKLGQLEKKYNDGNREVEMLKSLILELDSYSFESSEIASELILKCTINQIVNDVELLSIFYNIEFSLNSKLGVKYAELFPKVSEDFWEELIEKLLEICDTHLSTGLEQKNKNFYKETLEYVSKALKETTEDRDIILNAIKEIYGEEYDKLK